MKITYVYLNDKKIYTEITRPRLFIQAVKWLRKMFDSSTMLRGSLHEKVYRVSIKGSDYIVSSNGKVALYWKAPFVEELEYDTPYWINIMGSDIFITEHKNDSQYKSHQFALIPEEVKEVAYSKVCAIPSMIGKMGCIIDYKLFDKVKSIFNFFKEDVRINTYEKEYSPVLLEKNDFKALIMPYRQ